MRGRWSWHNSDCIHPGTDLRIRTLPSMGWREGHISPEVRVRAGRTYPIFGGRGRLGANQSGPPWCGVEWPHRSRCPAERPWRSRPGEATRASPTYPQPSSAWRDNRPSTAASTRTWTGTSDRARDWQGPLASRPGPCHGDLAGIARIGGWAIRADMQRERKHRSPYVRVKFPARWLAALASSHSRLGFPGPFYSGFSRSSPKSAISCLPEPPRLANG